MRFNKFPFVSQHQSSDCGIACLKMICKWYDVEFVSNGFNSALLSSKGMNLYEISKLSNEIGFSTQAVSATPESLRCMDSPCILHWNSNHFVVYFGYCDGRYIVGDPEKGISRMENDEFITAFVRSDFDANKGIALIFTLDRKKPIIRNLSITKMLGIGHQNIINYIYEELSSYKTDVIKILSSLFVTSILQFVIPFLMQDIVDIGINDSNFTIIFLILLGEFILISGMTISGFIRKWAMLRFAKNLNISMISKFLLKIYRLPMSFFDGKHLGDLMQRINDNLRIQSFLVNQFLTIWLNLFTIIIFGIVLLYYNKIIFLVFVIGSILYISWFLYFLKRRKNLDYAMFSVQSKNNSLMYETLISMQDIKLFGRDKHQHKMWTDIQNELFGLQFKSTKLKQEQEAGCIFISELRNIIITAMSAVSVIEGHLGLGAMLAIQYVIGMLNAPLEQLLYVLYMAQDAKLSFDRIREIEELDDECINSVSNPIHHMTGAIDICINNLYFSYTGYSPYILNDVTFKIKCGMITAIVGCSGSGKSTLLKLILKYYSPLSGQIKINGENLNDLIPDEWRKMFGTVLQDGVVYSDTIANNITCGAEKIDKSKIEKALKIACMERVISALPQGLDTVVGSDGHRLSEGQKQRLLIARAVYKNPPFFILDEATNALDTETERIIMDNLKEFYKNRTVIIVAHRLSTVRNADNIVVFNNGSITEMGKHDDLINKQGYYYRLIKNQL